MREMKILVVAILCLFLSSPLPAYSCTVFRLKATDGTIIVGRSMEFALDLKYDIIVVPRNKAYVSPAPDGKEGLSWKTRYGYVGVASFGLDYGLSDGMNEKGLAVGILWFESDMKWQDVAPGEEKSALSMVMVGDWILGSFTSVEDVKREVQKLKVFKYTDPQIKITPTIHFIVYDANGGCIIIEYEDGVCNIYDNPLGIMTNGPRFPWQLTNLRQYVGLTSEMPQPYEIFGLTFSTTGHGAGMLGLPGDLTPPSRFVRLAVLTRFSDIQPDAERTLNLAQHIINTFDIPFGLVTDTLPDKKTVIKESTQWVTFRDLTKHILYFKTYDNQNLRKIDLNKLDFSGTDVKRVPMFGISEILTDITDQAR
ncbi:MAG: choloylglycine hydrolase family protein [Deltaproteobacteria bacterium]|nr:choloylglycine hydrolase family protein [Candidatus Zymogenaceae bacterium]